VAVFVFSSLYVGLRGNEPGGQDNTPNPGWRIIQYDSAQPGRASALTKIVAETKKLKLIPADMTPSVDDLEAVFESNVTGVTGIVLENAPGYVMFSLDTDGSNVTDRIEDEIRLPAGYRIYRVYEASTPAGVLEVVGDGFAAGDYVKALLLERRRAGESEILGFAQNKVEEGPVVSARVLGFESLSFAGLSRSEVAGSDVESLLNATDVTVEESDNSTNETLWVVSFNMPAESDVGYVEGRLSALNVSNVTAGLLGYSETAEEMAVDGRLVRIPLNDMLQTSFSIGARVNDTVKVRVYLLALGNQTVAFARESSGNGTAAQ